MEQIIEQLKKQGLNVEARKEVRICRDIELMPFEAEVVLLNGSKNGQRLKEIVLYPFSSYTVESVMERLEYEEV